MGTLGEVRQLLGEVLQLGDRAREMDQETLLLGNLPELDSMAVAAVITALEECFGIVIEDDDMDGQTFETLGSLADFVDAKIGAPGDTSASYVSG